MTIKPSTKRKIVKLFLLGNSVDKISADLRLFDVIVSPIQIEDIIRKAAIWQEKKK